MLVAHALVGEQLEILGYTSFPGVADADGTSTDIE